MAGTDFRVISIGALAAHPLRGERGEVRPAHATTSLITSGKARILVDPSLPGPLLLPRLAERAGLEAKDITHVFLTCFHPLHRRGLLAFEKATWLVSTAEREAVGVHLIGRLKEAHDQGDEEVEKALGHEVAILERCQAAEDEVAEGVDLFPLHGVTPGLTGLLLPMNRLTVLVAGDAVATQEHLEQGQVLAPCHDLEKARASFGEAIEIADMIVAGRDNVIPNLTRQLF